MQQLALLLVKLLEIPMGLFLELVHVPLDDIPPFRHVSHTTQLSFIYRLAEGALIPLSVTPMGTLLVQMQIPEGHLSLIFS